VTKHIALTVLFLGLTFSACSWAAAPASLRFPRLHVEAGYGIPRTPDGFKDHWNSGLGVGGGIEAGVRKYVSVCFDADYNHHGANESRMISDFILKGQRRPVSDVIINGGSTSILTLLAGLKLEIPSPVRIAPYLKLGAGLGHVSQLETDMAYLVGGSVRSKTVPTVSEDMLFATSVGAGLQNWAPGSRIGYTIEARWVRIPKISGESTARQMVPVRAGLTFGF
jgi:hypothetical protein